MSRAVVLACLLGGCGRIGFDARDLAGAGDAGSSDGTSSDGPDASSSATIQRWQQSTVLNTTGPGTLTLPAPSLQGSLLVITLAANDLTSLTLPTGWTPAASTGGSGGCYGIIAYHPNTLGGLVSVGYTMAAGAPNVAQLIEITGASTTAPLDVVGQIAVSNPMGTQTVSTSSATTSPNELAVAMFCEDVNTPTYTPPGGAWMELGTFSNTSSSPSYEAAFTLPPTMGVVTATVTSDVTGKYTGLIATFRQ